MKKPVSKHTLRNQTFTLNLDKPWDTMKAQILIKISDALNPGLLSYKDYEISWFILHVLPKHGLSLLNENEAVIELTKEAAVILPENQNKIVNIQSLCEHWIWKKPDAACPSMHCYVDSSMDKHLHLNAEQFDLWTSAMLKDDGRATLEKPPHHKLFDVQKISPVLQ
ncbi:hypothetical protein DFH29DRAFT_1014852 [Suillus ampliporus]|nr:hypothetical protein DFH29DRAFT_1014852 [Suillus ampliporus]